VKAYVDTSVVLRSLFRQPGAIMDWSRWEMLVTSELMRVEAFRAIDRLRVMGELSETQLADTIDALGVLISRTHEMALHAEVLVRAAAPFPSVVGTMDAIHIATALLWMHDQDERLVFVTHDEQQALAARLAGFQVQT
jgi:predicted nucleic acid-binding protein